MKDKTIQKVCKIHGETDYRLRADDRYRCLKCSVDSVSKRRRLLKTKAIEYKGNKCEKCGYNRSYAALEFHNINPNEKDFGIASSGIIRSWERVKTELDKCVMVCANCHREIHDQIDKSELS